MMSVHFLDLINPGNPILYNAVCDHLNPLDLIHLLTTCKLLYRLKPLLWSINRSLRRFLKNPESFRSIMAKHNAIISGSHALQFLSRKEWPDSDLDVYVDGTVGIKSFGEYLTTQEGYVFSPYEFQSSHQNDAVDKREIEWRNYILGKMEEPDTDFDDVSSEMGIYCLSQIDGVRPTPMFSHTSMIKPILLTTLLVGLQLCQGFRQDCPDTAHLAQDRPFKCDTRRLLLHLHLQLHHLESILQSIPISYFRK